MVVVVVLVLLCGLTLIDGCRCEDLFALVLSVIGLDVDTEYVIMHNGFESVVIDVVVPNRPLKLKGRSARGRCITR